MSYFLALRTPFLLLFLVAFAGCSSLEEYNTQSFAAGGATCLSGKQLYLGHQQFDFLDKSSAYFHYSRFVTDVSALPIDPSSHEVIDFSQSDPFELQLPTGIEVTYYRQQFNVLFIGSDGTIAFGIPGTGNSSLVELFSSDQISLLPVDATVEGATTRYSVSDDEVVITYDSVEGNTFQCEFILREGLQDGIFISYLSVSRNTRDGVVGLPDTSHPALLRSDGLEQFLASSSFTESNLCRNSPLDPRGPAYFQRELNGN